MNKVEKGLSDLVVNFFNGIEAIWDLVSVTLVLLFWLLAIAVFACFVLFVLGIPFYGIAGYLFNDTGRRIIFSIPFVFGSILFIAWVGSRTARKPRK